MSLQNVTASAASAPRSTPFRSAGNLEAEWSTIVTASIDLPSSSGDLYLLNS